MVKLFNRLRPSSRGRDDAQVSAPDYLADFDAEWAALQKDPEFQRERAVVELQVSAIELGTRLQAAAAPPIEDMQPGPPADDEQEAS